MELKGIFRKTWLRCALIAFGLLGSVAAGQGTAFNPDSNVGPNINPPDVIQWTVVAGFLQSDGTVEVGLRLVTKKQFTIYSDKLQFILPPGFKLERMDVPESSRIIDPVFEKEVDVFTGGEFTLFMSSLDKVHASTFSFGVKYTGCTNVICLFPYTENLSVQLSPPSDAQSSISSTSTLTSPSLTAQGASKAGSGLSLAQLDQSVVAMLEAGTLPFWLILLGVALGGMASNLTPCVYPMIPITLRILGGNTKQPFLNSGLYGGGIVVTYTALGMFAGFTGTLFGSFMQNPTVNVVFALLMAGLALTMLGFGNMAAIQNIGNRMGSGQPSLRNYFLMGVGAGLVAAPCVGPVLLALLAYAAKAEDPFVATQLLFAYSVGFAAPYVILGGTAAKMSKKRTFSHHVQVGVKVLFAAVMFALAFYYLRIPLYRPLQSLADHWSTIAWSGTLLGILILGLWLAVPRLTNSKAMLIVPALVIGAGFFGTFRHITSASTDTGGIELTWHKDEATAFTTAAERSKPVFIDGWAEWCEACKKMDATTFMEPEVRRVLADGWVLLKLDLTESTPENDALIEKYKFLGLPSYALVPADGDLAQMQVHGGYQTAAQLLALLDQYLKGH